MGLTNRKDFFNGGSFCFFLVLSLCIRGVSSTNEFEIFRKKHDIFANLGCYDDSGSSKCTGSQCSQYEANCIEENNCKYCFCSKQNKETFIVTAEDKINVDGVCKSVEEILPGCFMAYLELRETGPKAAITTSASTFTEITDCRILKTFQFTQNGKQWKDKTGPPLMLKEINTHKIELEINSTEEFKFWNGSLLKITIACNGGHSFAGNEKHCVVLKLESLPRYDEIVEAVARVAIPNREYHNKNKLMDFLMNNGNSFFAREDQEDYPAPTTQNFSYYRNSTKEPYTFHKTTPRYYMTTRSYWGTTRSHRGPTRSYRGPTTRSYSGPTRSYRGPTTRSYRGPTTRSYRGPTTRSYRGPTTRSYRGPTTRSYRGPTTRSYRGPTTRSYTGPTTRSYRGPTTRSYRGPTTRSYRGPTTRSYRGPTTRSYRGPTTRSYRGPTTRSYRGPTTRSYRGPTTRSYRGPTTRSYRGPTTRSYRGPTTRSYRGPTTRSYRGPTTRSYRGPTTRSYRGTTRSYHRLAIYR